MSAMRSSGVHRDFGGSDWRPRPTSATSPPPASFSRRTVCHSPPFSVARQKHCGVTWAWMSMLRMGLLSFTPGSPGRAGYTAPTGTATASRHSIAASGATGTGVSWPFLSADR
jgi:hypothetical protein